MKTAGIICEYNPFHNGHLYQIQKTKEQNIDAVIAVMSGNFVQRGDVSIVPKAAKVQMAIEGGADLVLELPVAWAMSRAEVFARGAVGILKDTGVCDALSFGSECAQLSLLQAAKKAVEDARVEVSLGKYLEEGNSFVLARSKAVKDVYGEEIERIISSPNDILGMEYLKALEKSTIEPLLIARQSQHDKKSDNPFLKSAAQIREMILNDNPAYQSAVPQSTSDILREYASIGQCPISTERLNRSILTVLRKMQPEDYLQCPDIAEGLENRIWRAVMQSASFDEVLLRSKSKRYTMARIRRIVLSAFLGIDNTLAQIEVPYLRVLGFNETGKELLHQMRTKAAKPVVSVFSDVKQLNADAKAVFAMESRAADLYAIAFEKPSPCGTELTYSVYHAHGAE